MSFKVYLIMCIRKIQFYFFSKKIFIDIFHKLEACKIDYFLDFGSLLGCVRLARSIKNDNDIDIGLFYGDPKYNDLKKSLILDGYIQYFLVKDTSGIIIETFFKYGLYIDFYFYQKVNKNDVVTSIFKKCNEDYSETKLINSYIGTRKWLFYGKKVNIPINFDEWLCNIYGPDYIFPDPNYNGSKNIYRFIHKTEKAVSLKNEFILY